MHRFIAGKVRPLGPLDESVEKVFQDSDIDCQAELTEQDKALLSDLAAIRDKTGIPQEYYDYVNDSQAFSQLDMTLVQGAFFSQYLLYPRHYGGKSCSTEELECFLKLWRTHGYFLGIEDAFNAVQEELEESKIMAQLLMEKILKPCMLHLGNLIYLS